MFSDLEAQRQAGSRLLVAVIWLLAVAAAACRLMIGGPWLWLGLAGAIIAAAVTAGWRAAPASPQLRVAVAIGLMAEVSLLVAAFQGHPWQIDMHMSYFAALALLMAYCDWRAIVAAAATVAVHHLLLSYVLPSAVFPSSASLGRVLVHALILVVEAGALVAICGNIDRMLKTIQSGATETREALDHAQAAEEEARQAHQAQVAAEAAREAERKLTERAQVQAVDAVAEGLERLAEGDLSVRITADLRGRYGKLKDDFNGAVARLQQAMSSIAAASGQISARAQGVAAASGDLSDRTARQARSLATTAGSLGEITETVKRTADGARRAKDQASATRSDAEASGEVVRAAVSAVSSIERSSQEIGQIIGVIDEIAFQTNLLALNAGVEAARAGEAGKGFAVVAQEVRALAQRSADAAKQIKSLISSSAAQVDEGAGLVRRAGDALERIVERVGEIDQLITEIAGSAQDQSAGLGGVNDAVADMDGVVQQNAAMVSQAAQSSRELMADATELARLVGAFRLSGGSAAGPAPIAA